MAIISRPGTSSVGLSGPSPRLVAGIGCKRGTRADEIIALLKATLALANAGAGNLVAIGTLDSKADEAGLLTAAAYFGVPLRLFSPEQLEAAAILSPGQSAIVARHIGIAGVAEAAALRAGSLQVSKRKSANATCALGVCDSGFDLAGFGRPAAVHHSFSAEIASSMLATSSAGP